MLGPRHDHLRMQLIWHASPHGLQGIRPEHSWNLHESLISIMIIQRLHLLCRIGRGFHCSPATYIHVLVQRASNHYHLVGAAKNIRDIFHAVAEPYIPA